MANWARSAARHSARSDFRLVTSISLMGLAVSGLVLYASDRAGVMEEANVASQACQNADHARVAQLVEILERNRTGDAPVLERAVFALNTARRHCLYGWSDIAEGQYAWLDQWLDEHK